MNVNPIFLSTNNQACGILKTDKKNIVFKENETTKTSNSSSNQNLKTAGKVLGILAIIGLATMELWSEMTAKQEEIIEKERENAEKYFDELMKQLKDKDEKFADWDKYINELEHDFKTKLKSGKKR